MIRLRPATADDFGALVAILNAIRPEPLTPGGLIRLDALERQRPGALLERTVAVDDTGAVVGFGSISRDDALPPDYYRVDLGVAPAARGQGAGTLIYTELERRATELGAVLLRATCRGDDEACAAWAARRGFVEELQRTESVLDLTAWDGSRFAGHVDRVRAKGLKLLALPDIPDELQMLGMYTVMALTVLDVPNCEPGFPMYDQWRDEFTGLEAPRVSAIALDAGRVVGVSLLCLPALPGYGAETIYTGVLREYRRRGIATALKLLTIQAARDAGVPYMRTNNDFDNPPMLSLNAKLGYRLVQGPRWLDKVVG